MVTARWRFWPNVIAEVLGSCCTKLATHIRPKQVYSFLQITYINWSMNIIWLNHRTAITFSAYLYNTQDFQLITRTQNFSLPLESFSAYMLMYVYMYLCMDLCMYVCNKTLNIATFTKTQTISPVGYLQSPLIHCLPEWPWPSSTWTPGLPSGIGTWTQMLLSPGKRSFSWRTRLPPPPNWTWRRRTALPTIPTSTTGSDNVQWII